MKDVIRINQFCIVIFLSNYSNNQIYADLFEQFNIEITQISRLAVHSENRFLAEINKITTINHIYWPQFIILYKSEIMSIYN